MPTTCDLPVFPWKEATAPRRTALESILAATAAPTDHPVLPAWSAGSGPPPGCCRESAVVVLVHEPGSSRAGRTTCVVIAYTVASGGNGTWATCAIFTRISKDKLCVELAMKEHVPEQFAVVAVPGGLAVGVDDAQDERPP